jgi:hypothetical protein
VRAHSATAIAVLALLVTLGGTGYAVLGPDATGPLSACADKRTGKLRLIEARQSCRKATRRNAGETAVGWNLPGASGPAGPAGTAGATGESGRDGAGWRVVLRARGGSGTTMSGSEQDVPVTPNRWTQATGDVERVVGELRYHVGSNCAGFPLPAIFGDIRIDGKSVSFVLDLDADGRESFTGVLTDPATADTEHQLTVTLRDSCTGADHFVIDSVAIDVLSVR